jgi:hypothetical protein
VLGVALLAPPPIEAETEWQIRPFAGMTFGGGTTLNDPDDDAGRPNLVFGGSGGLLGEVFGIEGDFGHAPGFFGPRDQNLVLKSSVMTITGNVIVGLPRRATEYTLRPYGIGGFGLMRARVYNAPNALDVLMTRPAMNVGGGVTGALSDRTGLGWELRYFRSLGGQPGPQSFGPERLSFWRASMALIIRY